MPAMPTYQVPVVVERDGKSWHAFCLSIHGCRSHGPTYEKALESIQDAIRLNLELMRERGEPFTMSHSSLTTVDVAL